MNVSLLNKQILHFFFFCSLLESYNTDFQSMYFGFSYNLFQVFFQYSLDYTPMYFEFSDKIFWLFRQYPPKYIRFTTISVGFSSCSELKTKDSFGNHPPYIFFLYELPPKPLMLGMTCGDLMEPINGYC